MSIDYNPFGEQWEKEINKLPKSELVNMIRQLQTGAKHKRIAVIETEIQAQKIVEGIINDFDNGVYTKDETLGLLGEYTARLMHLFWKRAKEIIKENPEIINE